MSLVDLSAFQQDLAVLRQLAVHIKAAMPKVSLLSFSSLDPRVCESTLLLRGSIDNSI